MTKLFFYNNITEINSGTVFSNFKYTKDNVQHLQNYIKLTV